MLNFQLPVFGVTWSFRNDYIILTCDPGPQNKSQGPIFRKWDSYIIWNLNKQAFHWCMVCYDRTIFGRDTTILQFVIWGCKKNLNIEKITSSLRWSFPSLCLAESGFWCVWQDTMLTWLSPALRLLSPSPSRASVVQFLPLVLVSSSEAPPPAPAGPPPRPAYAPEKCINYMVTHLTH